MSGDAAVGSVAVYCSSRNGLARPFVEAAEVLGRGLAQRGVRVVYGGGGVGLMGVVANAALAAGGRVVGVIPRDLIEHEKLHPGLAEKVITDTMHARKAEISVRADAFVALPGGVGTLDEVFEAITWNQLGIHTKPIVFVDIDGFYAPLRRFLEHARDAGFIPGATLEKTAFVPDAAAALAALGIA